MAHTSGLPAADKADIPELIHVASSLADVVTAVLVDLPSEPVDCTTLAVLNSADQPAQTAVPPSPIADPPTDMNPMDLASRLASIPPLPPKPPVSSSALLITESPPAASASAVNTASLDSSSLHLVDVEVVFAASSDSDDAEGHLSDPSNQATGRRKRKPYTKKELRPKFHGHQVVRILLSSS